MDILTLKTKITITKYSSIPYCKYLVPGNIFPSYLFVIHPSAKYNSEDNLLEDIKPLVAE